MSGCGTFYILAILQDHIDTPYISSSAGNVYCECVIIGFHIPWGFQNNDNHSRAHFTRRRGLFRKTDFELSKCSSDSMGYFCGPQATPRHAAPSTPHPPYLPPIHSAIVFPTTVMNIKTLAYLRSGSTRIHAYGRALSRDSIKPTGHTQRRILFCPSLLSFLPSSINRHLLVECGNEISWMSVWFYKIQAETSMRHFGPSGFADHSRG
jgi:hypothetical protein